MINSRNLDDLDPDVKTKAEAFMAACDAAGIDVLVTSTYRDFESQAALYAQGRTAQGPRVTNAKPGQSAHNYRLAFDFVPIVGGKAIWDDDSLWLQCGRIGQDCGLEWGGSWLGFRDRPHMQDLGGKTIEELKYEAGVA